MVEMESMMIAMADPRLSRENMFEV
jgi:hypothetical protein